MIPEGDTKKILKNYARSYITSPNDIKEVSRTISKAIGDIQTENLKPLSSEWLEAYTTKSITQSLAHELDALID